MKVHGSLIIISAPSGTGKTSLVKALLEEIPTMKKSVSHTTRPMRAGEENGQHYYFVSKSEFDAALQHGDFLEHAEVFGNYYGTSKNWVVNALDSGDDVILEIDWQGAQQICKQILDVVTIFLLPPSAKVLADRLNSRNSDDAKVIERRLAQAKNEVSHYNEYEYLIVNDDFEQAQQELVTIVRAARLRTAKQAPRRQALIAELSKKA